MEDGKKFREMVIVICEKHEKIPSPILSDMIWAAITPYSDEDCIAAFNHVFRYGRFFKDIVPDLLEYLEGLTPQPAIEATATVEADKIISHLKVYGGSKQPEITDSITKYLMSQRWPYLDWSRQILESELVWWKKEFVESYQSHLSTGNVQIEATGKNLKLVEGIG